MVYKKIDRATVLTRITQFFRSHGFHFSSLSALARECGLSKASLYHYGSSKDELLAWVLEAYLNKIRTEVFLKTRVFKGDAEEKLVFLSRQLKHFYEESTEGCLMTNLSAEICANQPKQLVYIKTFFSEWQQVIAEILKERLNEEMANRIALDVTMQCQGALLMQRIYGFNSTFQRVLTRLENLLGVRENELLALSEG